MDLIYTDRNRVDIGVIDVFKLDFESSTEVEKNTFEISQPIDHRQLSDGMFWYVENEEYGGKVDSIKIDTKSRTVLFGGRTWRGMLTTKIVAPNAGQDYYTQSGDLNDIMAAVISRVGLSSLFKASGDRTKSVQFRFDRYTDCLSGFTKMLSRNGYKLRIRWDNGKVEVAAVPITDWSNEEEMSSDLFDFVMKKDRGAVNHLICLGSGELKNRQVVHLYVDKNGNIGKTQYYTGLDEIVDTYDYGNAESLEDLEENGIKHLEDKCVEDSLEISANNLEADIGDRFLAYDMDMEISVTQYVTNKITTYDGQIMDVQYEVGASVI